MPTNYYSQQDVSNYAQLAKFAVRRRIARLIEWLYPQGTRVGDRWLICDKYGNPGTSLSIELVGRDAGTCRDATTGERLDIIALWKAGRDVDFFTALHELEHWKVSRKPSHGCCTDAPTAGGAPGPSAKP